MEVFDAILTELVGILLFVLICLELLIPIAIVYFLLRFVGII